MNFKQIIGVLLDTGQIRHRGIFSGSKRWFIILTLFFLVIILFATPLVAHAVTIITDFEAFSTPTFNGTVVFRQPSFSGSTSGKILSSPDITQVVRPLGGIGGNTTNILMTTFAWNSSVSNHWLRLTTFDTPGPPTRPVPNPQANLSQWLFFDMYSVKSVNLFGVGIRETGTSGPIGSDGGFSGPIEWVSNAPLGAWPDPIAGGMLINPNTWYTIGIDLAASPHIRGFTGDGNLSGNFGVLEHLAFTPANDLGITIDPHIIYLDNFRQSTAPVPEPLTMLLLGFGLVGLGIFRKKFRKK